VHGDRVVERQRTGRGQPRDRRRNHRLRERADREGRARRHHLPRGRVRDAGRDELDVAVAQVAEDGSRNRMLAQET
jgi:hypothetical protein